MKRKGERTRERILEVAAQLFWKRSYHGVNMNEIASAAAVNKASLYQYFPSKEQLALATIAYNASATGDWVFDRSFAATSDPMERLSLIYQRVYETTKAAFDADGLCPGCPFVNIGVEMATDNVLVREAVNETFRAFGEYYLRIVRDLDANRGGTNAGELVTPYLDEDLAVDFLLSNMNGAMVASKLQNRPEAILDGFRTAQKILEAAAPAS